MILGNFGNTHWIGSVMKSSTSNIEVPWPCLTFPWNHFRWTLSPVLHGYHSTRHGRSWCSYHKFFMRSYKLQHKNRNHSSWTHPPVKYVSRHPASERHVPPVSSKHKNHNLGWYVPGSKLLTLGMVILPLIGNPYNGCINPYYWVDDHLLLYGNFGSLDPSTYTFPIPVTTRTITCSLGSSLIFWSLSTAWCCVTPKQSPSSNLLFWERINVVQQLLCAQCCIPGILL